MKHEHIFLIAIGLLFGALTIVFLTFPRSVFSQVERRELKQFPEYSHQRLADGSFTAGISSWFSDSEPFRDQFMTFSMALKDHMAWHREGDERVSFREAEDFTAAMMPGSEADGASDVPSELPGDEESKTAAAGILLVGSGNKVRALMNYGGEAMGGGPFIAVVKSYHNTMPDIRLYAMVIPTAMEFYCPLKVRESKRFKSQEATIKHINSSLEGVAKGINLCPVMHAHAREDIYLRTDHHWAPLGAFYAAKELAASAGVPFRDLSHYERRVVHNFVGTMYGYSKDISVKNSPEDFVYYLPKDAKYTTTYTNFSIDEDFNVTGEGRPVNGAFFVHFKDGSSGAYSTFMGGDSKITKVRTGVNNGRRLVIIKDSFGNAIPGYLFSSFEEIHVVDFRYFPRNLVKYCRDNGVTDLVFAVNIFSAYSGSVAAKLRAFLSDPVRTKAKHEPAPTDTSAVPETPVVPATPVTPPDPASAPVAVPDSI